MTGDSQSKLVSEILKESEPVFDRLIRVLEAAEAAKVAMKSSSAARLGEAQDLIEQQLGIMLEGFDHLAGGLIKEAEAVKRRAARKRPEALAGERQPLTPRPPAASLGGSEEAIPTPMSNRGVRSDPNNKKQQLTKNGTGVKNDSV